MKRSALLQVFALACMTPLLFLSCQADPGSDGLYDIAVFVPGVTAGSPTYEMMVEGVDQAVAELNARGTKARYRVVEGGYNQGEWQAGLIALAADPSLDLVVSSNPSLPELAVKASETNPRARFLIMDARLSGANAVKTIGFDNYQQGYLNGRLTGLYLAGKGLKVAGILAGQEYPVMDDEIRPGFHDGLVSVVPDGRVEYRVLGNWYDAARAEELSLSMTDAGAGSILAIAGGGNQGVVAAARKTGTGVTWFDSPGYSFGPGVVTGGTVVRQTTFCRDGVLAAAAGPLDFGTATVHGILDDAVDFAWGPELEAGLGSENTARLLDWIQAMKAGKAELPRKP